MDKERILLGMSGGMDSACAVALLRNLGYDVCGAVLKMHGYTDISGAKEAAEALGIPLVTVDCTADFDREVCGPFCSEYAAGRTPNPCVICNEKVKFACLAKAADEMGIEKISTGHYAGIAALENGKFCITKARDETKDQSYMLWRLPQDILRRLVLPLCERKKTELREEARSMGLAAAEKPESQEICFIPDNNYAEYIENKLNKTFPAGDITDESGKVIGKHNGIVRYTVGQRKGIGAYGRPMFVKRIDAENNLLILGESGKEFSDTLTVDGTVFSGTEPFEGERMFYVKLRYRARPQKAYVTLNGSIAHVRLEEPARAITPGQSAVFYDGDKVAFGGFII